MDETKNTIDQTNPENKLHVMCMEIGTGFPETAAVIYKYIN